MNNPALKQRVKVAIEDHSSYATGCAKCLDGKTGIVIRCKDSSYCGKHSRGPAVLVEFDSPAETWWSHQTPATAFWFPPSDLVAA